MSHLITRTQLVELAASLVQRGTGVIAPVRMENGNHLFQELVAGTPYEPNPTVRTVNSIKEFFFPKTERICSYQRHENDVDVTDSPQFDREQVILGCRPCEAAALPILDPLFAWDYQDRFYQSRRARTTVVSFACSESDSSCFCTAVGGAPDNTSGSDALLFSLPDGSFEVRCLTEKGKALFAGKTTDSDQVGKSCPPPAKTFEAKEIAAWIADHFSDSFWNEVALSCVGCGVCTYTCPTCHCFDIVDRGTFFKGDRVKNWDSCQFAIFTKHASGHNPRPDQGARQRQRLLHKFSIYPEKFGLLLCTGCGNCTRMCGVSLGIRPVLEAIEQRRAQDKK